MAEIAAASRIRSVELFARGARVTREVTVPELAGTVEIAVPGVTAFGGAVFDCDQTFAGRGRVSFIAPGERFAIGFGADDGLRVRREVHEERDTAALTGTQKRRHEVELFLSNLSGARRVLEVQERIPVSEIEDLEIRGDAPGWNIDADGFARRTVEVAPGEHLKLELAWELRAGSNVTLPY